MYISSCILVYLLITPICLYITSVLLRLFLCDSPFYQQNQDINGHTSLIHSLITVFLNYYTTRGEHRPHMPKKCDEREWDRYRAQTQRRNKNKLHGRAGNPRLCPKLSTLPSSVLARVPHEESGVDLERGPLWVEPEMLLNELWRDADHVLPLPVSDQVERLQRRDDVLGLDARLVRQLLDAQRAPKVAQDLEQHARPVRAVAQQAEVGQRLFGAAHLALALGELVAEGNEQPAIALALVRREGQDASDVVVVGRLFFFRKVADNMAAKFVRFGHDVKEEGLNVIVKRLVVKEELGK